MALLRLDLLLELEADQSDHAAEDYRREYVTAGRECAQSPHPPKTPPFGTRHDRERHPMVRKDRVDHADRGGACHQQEQWAQMH